MTELQRQANLEFCEDCGSRSWPWQPHYPGFKPWFRFGSRTRRLALMVLEPRPGTDVKIHFGVAKASNESEEPW